MSVAVVAHFENPISTECEKHINRSRCCLLEKTRRLRYLASQTSQSQTMGILGYILLRPCRVMEKKMETTIMELCGSQLQCSTVRYPKWGRASSIRPRSKNTKPQGVALKRLQIYKEVPSLMSQGIWPETLQSNALLHALTTELRTHPDEA